MNSELESEEKATQKPDLRRRIRLSLWLLLFLAAITSWRVYLVRWPTEGPSWNGLTVGKSTTEDVLAMLGTPEKITNDWSTGTMYHYEERLGESLARPTIYFRNNQVIRIRVFNESKQNADLFTFVEQYGKPDHIIDELGMSIHVEHPTKGVYWTDEGIFLGGVFEGGTIVDITYSRPCPLIDSFCIMAEQWVYGGPAPPGEDIWGIMSPLPTPTLTPIP